MRVLSSKLNVVITTYVCYAWRTLKADHESPSNITLTSIALDARWALTGFLKLYRQGRPRKHGLIVVKTAILQYSPLMVPFQKVQCRKIYKELWEHHSCSHKRISEALLALRWLLRMKMSWTWIELLWLAKKTLIYLSNCLTRDVPEPSQVFIRCVSRELTWLRACM